MAKPMMKATAHTRGSACGKPMAYKAYMICTSPRSGSTLLCSLLRETGVAGNPNSHFHFPSLEKWLATYHLHREDFSTENKALKAVFAKAIQRGRGANPVFGLRMQRPSFPFFATALASLYPNAPAERQRLEDAFGPTLFISLNRPDKIEQAISYVIAEQTGLWHRAADGSELERVSPPQPPRYDEYAIARELTALQKMQDEWEEWFAREGITPHRISYDHLSEAPQATLASILKALGLDPSAAATITPPTAKLANQTNQEWAKRFREAHQSHNTQPK